MDLIGYWSRQADTSLNFGDALNPAVLSAMSGSSIVHYDDASLWRQRMNPVVYGVGSILERRKSGLQVRKGRVHIWGTGTRGEKSLSHLKGTRIHAVRGPLTRKRLLEHGIDCPECYGDPALLLPRLLNADAVASDEMAADQKTGIVLVPHYVDRQACLLWLDEHCPNLQVTVLDVFDPLESIVSHIRQASFVLSSSLHGLIVSDAFRVPNARIKFSDDISGKDFKFDDYALSVGRAEGQVTDLRKTTSLEPALGSCELGDTGISAALIAAFPAELKAALDTECVV